MNPQLCLEAAESLGLSAGTIFSLQHSTITERKAATMAAVPHLYGLRLWVSGEEILLIDTQGFVARTTDRGTAILLCRLESTLGPGAVRVLLSREPTDPFAAITALDPRFRLKPKPVEERHRINPKTPRGASLISPEVLANILSEL
jgi:hypothetical protein